MWVKIPVEYKVWGTVEVEADSLEEALKYAKANKDELELPYYTEYIEDSYVIAADDVEELKLYNKNID